MRSETVNQWLAERGENPAFRPMAEYIPEGDCIEFLLSNEPSYARRLDGWVTVYYGERSGELVGGQIKGVKRSLLERYPGLIIEIEGNQVRVACLLRASAWTEADDLRQRTYKAIIQKVEAEDFTALLPA